MTTPTNGPAMDRTPPPIDTYGNPTMPPHPDDPDASVVRIMVDGGSPGGYRLDVTAWGSSDAPAGVYANGVLVARVDDPNGRTPDVSIVDVYATRYGLTAGHVADVWRAASDAFGRVWNAAVAEPDDPAPRTTPDAPLPAPTDAPHYHVRPATVDDVADHVDPDRFGGGEPDAIAADALAVVRPSGDVVGIVGPGGPGMCTYYVHMGVSAANVMAAARAWDPDDAPSPDGADPATWTTRPTTDRDMDAAGVSGHIRATADDDPMVSVVTPGGLVVGIVHTADYGAAWAARYVDVSDVVNVARRACPHGRPRGTSCDACADDVHTSSRVMPWGTAADPDTWRTVPVTPDHITAAVGADADAHGVGDDDGMDAAAYAVVIPDPGMGYPYIVGMVDADASPVWVRDGYDPDDVTTAAMASGVIPPPSDDPDTAAGWTVTDDPAAADTPAPDTYATPRGVDVMRGDVPRTMTAPDGVTFRTVRGITAADMAELRTWARTVHAAAATACPDDPMAAAWLAIARGDDGSAFGLSTVYVMTAPGGPDVAAVVSTVGGGPVGTGVIVAGPHMPHDRDTLRAMDADTQHVITALMRAGGIDA